MIAHTMTVQELRDYSVTYAQANLVEACRELMVQRETGILPEGHVRFLSSMWAQILPSSHQSMSESFFATAAIEYVARG